MDSEIIADKIIKGIKSAFDYAEKSRGQIEAQLKPEYLLTVKIAESIATLNEQNGYPLIIKLEEPTLEFSNSCVPNFTPTNFTFRDSHDSKTRVGKIDIAVYSGESHKQFHYPKALFPIEVKSFNNTKYCFLADVERNIEFFKIKDVNTGDSLLELAYCISLEDSRIQFLEDKEKEIMRIKEKYGNWLCTLENEEPTIEFNIFTQTICENLYERNYSPNFSEGESETDYFNNSYHYVGVILIMTKRT